MSGNEQCVFALVASQRYYDSDESRWEYYDGLAGLFYSASAAIEAAKAISDIDPKRLDATKKKGGVDNWFVIEGEALFDGLFTTPECSERTDICGWSVVPLKLGGLSLKYSNPEEHERKVKAHYKAIGVITSDPEALPTVERVNYPDMTNAELRAEIQRRGLSAPAKANKNRLIDILTKGGLDA